jgi:hypothetical protein
MELWVLQTYVQSKQYLGHKWLYYLYFLTDLGAVWYLNQNILLVNKHVFYKKLFSKTHTLCNSLLTN